MINPNTTASKSCHTTTQTCLREHTTPAHTGSKHTPCLEPAKHPCDDSRDWATHQPTAHNTTRTPPLHTSTPTAKQNATQSPTAAGPQPQKRDSNADTLHRAGCREKHSWRKLLLPQQCCCGTLHAYYLRSPLLNTMPLLLPRTNSAVCTLRSQVTPCAACQSVTWCVSLALLCSCGQRRRRRLC